jgi:hydrogenase-4 component F
MTALELAIVLAVAIPMLGGALAWVLQGRASDAVALACGLAGLVLAAGLAVAALAGQPLTAWGTLVRLDALGGWMLLVIVGVGFVALAASAGWLDHAAADGHLGGRDRGLYWALLLSFLAGLVAVPLTDDLGLLWVAIEATTIVAALLIGFARTPEAIEAAWKSLILGSVGVGFALLGTLLTYASSVGILGETSEALAWSRLMAVAPELDGGLVRLAFVFVLVGYGTKSGLAPFHPWLPDAHSQAPSPVSAVLSGATLAVALYALARFHLVAMGALGGAFSSTLLVAFGLLSLAVAMPFLVAQGDVKRLLAYSSIEHLGLGALALGFGGALALGGLVLHLLAHGLAKASLFVSAGALVEGGGSRRIGRLRGSLDRAPADGRAFLAGAVLLSGLPPSALFVTEVAIVLGGVAAGWGWAAALAALLLALAVAGFLFHAVRIATGRGHRGGEAPVATPPAAAADRRARSSAGRARAAGAVAVGLPLAAVLILGLWTPPPVSDAIDRVVTVLEGGGG